jgi:hypothetical protein
LTYSTATTRSDSQPYKQLYSSKSTIKKVRYLVWDGSHKNRPNNQYQRRTFELSFLGINSHIDLLGAALKDFPDFMKNRKTKSETKTNTAQTSKATTIRAMTVHKWLLDLSHRGSQQHPHPLL